MPTEVDGLPVDIEAVGEIVPQSYAYRYQPRPVPCGMSISNINLPGSGTLGCLVVLNSGHLCILSNNHVMANENAAQIGDAIIQPGNAERVPASDEVIGSLLSYVPIQATGNWVDAAVAWTNFGLVSPWHVSYMLNPSAVPQAASLGLTVIKNGRTTQATLGMITDIGISIPVKYRPFPAGAEMINQIAIKGIGGSIFSMGGDLDH